MKTLLPLLLGLAAGAVHAEDRTELERTPIVGNRELPKVLYIVPWKKPPPPVIAARPPGSVLDERPAPLDREVFRRQLRLQPAPAAAATPAATPAPTGDTR